MSIILDSKYKKGTIARKIGGTRKVLTLKLLMMDIYLQKLCRPRNKSKDHLSVGSVDPRECRGIHKIEFVS